MVGGIHSTPIANWVKTENGGYSDIRQAVPWKDILQWQVDMFFYSCYLYYVMDDPKLSEIGRAHV